LGIAIGQSVEFIPYIASQCAFISELLGCP